MLFKWQVPFVLVATSASGFRSLCLDSASHSQAPARRRPFLGCRQDAGHEEAVGNVGWTSRLGHADSRVSVRHVNEGSTLTKIMFPSEAVNRFNKY